MPHGKPAKPFALQPFALYDKGSRGVDPNTLFQEAANRSDFTDKPLKAPAEETKPVAAPPTVEPTPAPPVNENLAELRRDRSQPQEEDPRGAFESPPERPVVEQPGRVGVSGGGVGDENTAQKFDEMISELRKTNELLGDLPAQLTLG